MWAETVWALTYAMLAILRQHVIWLAATSEMSSRLLHTVVFTPSIANSTWMDSWKKKKQWRGEENLMKNQKARATWIKERSRKISNLCHTSQLQEYFSVRSGPLCWHCYRRIPQRIAMLWTKRSISTKGPEIRERFVWQDLCGGQCSSTDESEGRISLIISLPLVFFLSMATDEPGQMARTLSLRENNR